VDAIIISNKDLKLMEKALVIPQKIRKEQTFDSLARDADGL